MNPIFFKILIFAVIFSVLIAAGSADSHQQVTISDGIVDAVGGTRNVTLVMDQAPAGLSGYIITLTIADPAIAQFTAWQTPTWADMATLDTPVPASEIEVKAATYTSDKVPNGSVNVLLGTTTIEGLAAGTTTITATLTNVDDNQGNNYIPTTDVITGTFTVGSGQVTTASAQQTSSPQGGGGGGGPSGSSLPGTTSSTGTVTAHTTTPGGTTMTLASKKTAGAVASVPTATPVTPLPTTDLSIGTVITAIAGAAIGSILAWKRRDS